MTYHDILRQFPYCDLWCMCGVCFDIMSFPPVGNICIVRTLCLFTHTTTGPVWTQVVLSPCKLHSNYTVTFCGVLDCPLPNNKSSDSCPLTLLQWWNFKPQERQPAVWKPRNSNGDVCWCLRWRGRWELGTCCCCASPTQEQVSATITVLSCIPGTPVKWLHQYVNTYYFGRLLTCACSFWEVINLCVNMQQEYSNAFCILCVC